MKIDKIASLERKIKRLKKQVESSTEMRNRFQAECVRYKNSLLDTMTRLTEDNRRLKDEVTRGAFRLSELMDKEAASYIQNGNLMMDLEQAAKHAAHAKHQINFLRDQLDRATNTPWRRFRMAIADRLRSLRKGKATQTVQW
jgi:chromosome segregation ATPase